MEKDAYFELPAETINRFIHPCRQGDQMRQYWALGAFFKPQLLLMENGPKN